MQRRHGTAELLDHELRMRGTTLDAWAEARGLTSESLVSMIRGRGRVVPAVVLELEEAIGANVCALRAA